MIEQRRMWINSLIKCLFDKSYYSQSLCLLKLPLETRWPYVWFNM